ncbi:hypothetical protein NC652_008345 [Populus alba x Populus x berolinensis]|uniref:Uncharacterized protein n=1 Tax=Populus alba x Populus x berolinensis TaxID=444605 RepID=A0AAD6R6I5_9ROSI|nr:hypothetical protein NC652_008345 [Populus alba x Populus x berolinensis]KAJ7003123.1 hypothetical protein NC653_008381 [Populus alba x Populus x berolinensis]
MFDRLTRSNKTSVKITKTRLEAVKKKKNSVIKHLKNDMADLIRTDHAYKAFCRAEGLLAEQNMIIYYNFIEQLCDCISSNLSLMNKQKYALLFNMLSTTYFLLFINSFFSCIISLTYSVLHEAS